MDNLSDDTIRFDEMGRCNYCTAQLENIGKIYFPNEDGKRRLNELLHRVKIEGGSKKYDCLMGLSGGLDSSYLAYLGFKWGLKVLAVHVADGFDSEIAKSNLIKLVEATGFQLVTIIPDRQQYCSLIKAYMKAGVANLAAPQDNVLFAYLYNLLRKEKIKYFLSGGNFALESILQEGNTHKATDAVNIHDINRQFGNNNLNRLKFISSMRRDYYRKVLKIQIPQPLDYINYNREQAFEELNQFCGFEYYGRKHLENILTAFTQLYWLPKKFGVDKRTSHLSSMIVSGQISREEALVEYSQPLYEENLMKQYIQFIKKCLNINDEEFEEIMRQPARNHTDFKTEKNSLLYKFIYGYIVRYSKLAMAAIKRKT